MPIIVVAVGVTLVVLMQCWVTGVLGDMIVFNARFATGHVKVMSRAYNDNIGQQPNDLALMGTDQILQDLDLQDIKHLKVGNPLKKYISGGQRKRLNIALELIREPSVL